MPREREKIKGERPSYIPSVASCIGQGRVKDGGSENIILGLWVWLGFFFFLWKRNRKRKKKKVK